MSDVSLSVVSVQKRWPRANAGQNRPNISVLGETRLIESEGGGRNELKTEGREGGDLVSVLFFLSDRNHDQSSAGGDSASAASLTQGRDTRLRKSENPPDS